MYVLCRTRDGRHPSVDDLEFDIVVGAGHDLSPEHNRPKVESVLVCSGALGLGVAVSDGTFEVLEDLVEGRVQDREGFLVGDEDGLAEASGSLCRRHLFVCLCVSVSVSVSVCVCVCV